MNQTSDCNFWYFRYQVIQKQVFKKSYSKPFQSCQLPHTAHSAQIWQISPFIPAYHLLPSKSAHCTIFLKSNSDNPLSGLPENHSERSGSFHDYSNDLRPAVVHNQHEMKSKKNQQYYIWVFHIPKIWQIFKHFTRAFYQA